MSVLKNAFIEWQEGLDRAITQNSNLSNKDLIQLEMERLNDCINNQFDDEPDHEDDGDALASAGLGTDEDYGYFGEDSQL